MTETSTFIWFSFPFMFNVSVEFLHTFTSTMKKYFLDLNCMSSMVCI